MIEVGEQNFVARTEFAADGAADGEGQRGHVGAEDHLILVAAKEIRHGGAGFGNDSVGAAAGGVSAAGVGVRVLQIIADGVDHPLRNLSAAGAVEKDRRLAGHGLGQRRELGAHPGEIEGGGFGLVQLAYEVLA